MSADMNNPWDSRFYHAASIDAERAEDTKVRAALVEALEGLLTCFKRLGAEDMDDDFVAAIEQSRAALAQVAREGT